MIFLGSSRKDLQAFPEDARIDLGGQLWDVQNDDEPKNWRPMPSIGPGVRELVHVLHAFQKKTQQTAQRDIDLAKRRLREVS